MLEYLFWYSLLFISDVFLFDILIWISSTFVDLSIDILLSKNKSTDISVISPSIYRTFITLKKPIIKLIPTNIIINMIVSFLNKILRYLDYGTLWIFNKLFLRFRIILTAGVVGRKRVKILLRLSRRRITDNITESVSSGSYYFF